MSEQKMKIIDHAEQDRERNIALLRDAISQLESGEVLAVHVVARLKDNGFRVWSDWAISIHEQVGWLAQMQRDLLDYSEISKEGE